MFASAFSVPGGLSWDWLCTVGCPCHFFGILFWFTRSLLAPARRLGLLVSALGLQLGLVAHWLRVLAFATPGKTASSAWLLAPSCLMPNQCYSCGLACPRVRGFDFRWMGLMSVSFSCPFLQTLASSFILFLLHLRLP